MFPSENFYSFNYIMKERIKRLKAVVSKLESRTKKIILAGIGGLIVFAIVIVLFLNRNSGYEVLFPT